MHDVYSPIEDAVQELYQADARARVHLGDAMKRVDQEMHQVMASLEQAVLALADLRKWCGRPDRSCRTDTLADHVRTRIDHVIDRIKALQSDFGVVDGPDAWRKAVHRSIRALTGTAAKANVELEHLRNIDRAIPELDSRVLAAHSVLARLDRWATGPGAQIQASTLIRDLQAQVARVRAELGQGELSLAAAESSDQWSARMTVLVALSRGCEHMEMLAAALEGHEGAIRRWQLEVASVRAAVDAMRAWCDRARAWEFARPTSALIDQHMIAARDELVRQCGQIARATSADALAKALCPVAQLTSVKNEMECARRGCTEFISRLDREEVVLEKSVLHEQEMERGVQSLSARWVPRVVGTTCVVAVVWKLAVDGPLAWILLVGTLGVGAYVLVMLARSRQAKTDAVTRARTMLDEFRGRAEPLRKPP